MRNLLTALAALVVILAIVSGVLWRDLRSERQLVADLKAQISPEKTAELVPAPAPAQTPAPAPASAPVPRAPTAPNPAPAPVAQVPVPRPAPALVKPGPALSTTLPELVVPVLVS